MNFTEKLAVKQERELENKELGKNKKNVPPRALTIILGHSFYFFLALYFLILFLVLLPTFQ